jgi:phosphoglycerol transferase MdoB-like AlkP superfamily enzyme
MGPRRLLNRLAGIMRNPRALLGIYTLLLLAGLTSSYALSWSHNGWPAGVMEYMRLLLPACVEVLAFWCIGWSLIGHRGLRGHPWRTLLFLANTLLFSVLMPAQCYALLYSNSFISVLALENVAEARLAANMWQPLLIVAAVMASVVLVLLCRIGVPLGRGPSPLRRYATAAVAMLCAVAAFSTNTAAPVADGAGGLQAGQSPVTALLLTSWQKWRLYHYDALTRGAVHDDAPYPYLKDWVNRRPLPFPGHPPVAQPNVIVLFIEGMSARTLEPYGNAFPGLTPNLQAFAGDTMVVDNYYNHTAATYRGLQGQMTSGFPRYGGSEGGKGWMEGQNAAGYATRSYSSLSRVLHRAGYHTVFFAPHPSISALNRLIEMLGFDELYNRERSVRTLLQDDPVQPFIRNALTDHDLFLALRRYLEKSDGKQPFFIGLYNIGTHAFMDVGANGKEYGDGSNHSLNTIHNLDAQFGDFYRWFLDSPYADNTLLIFTSDHAHYPEPSYVQVARDPRTGSDEYDPYFVDRIPMFVRAPWLRLPKRFDAHDRTSLGLAPTVLSLVGIDRARNSFVGQSIFRPYDTGDPGLRIAPLGPSMYAIYHGRVYAPGKIPAQMAARYEHEVLRAHRYHVLEDEGRIFPAHGQDRGSRRAQPAATALPAPGTSQ